MARKARTTTRPRAKAKPKVQNRLVKSLSGILAILILLVGLFKLGIIGTLVMGLFELIGGETAPELMVVAIIYCLGLTLYGRFPRVKVRWLSGAVLFYAGLLLALHVAMFDSLNAHSHYLLTTWNSLNRAIINGDTTVAIGGGLLGGLLYSGTVYLVADLGAQVLAWLLMLVGVVVFFDLPWHRVIDGLATLVSAAIAKYRAKQKEARQAPIKSRVQQRHQSGLLARFKDHRPSPRTEDKDLPEPIADQPPQGNESAAAVAPSPSPAPAPKIMVAGQPKPSEPASDAGAEPELAGANGQGDDEDYQLPPTTLLTEVAPTDQTKDLEAIKENTSTLQDTLQSFGVEATVENVSLGPSVTKYELRPAVGVKVAKITHLADDLALALAAKDIRIEAPIPGKSLVGIEVPNQKIATVGFRSLEEATPNDGRPLAVPLGRTVSGDVMVADLTKMPHLLIAGATGSGKSVAINVILTSILFKAKPSQVKMLLIDPKKVELSVYNGIPHLLSPVVSDPKKAARALAKVVAEMERRYELFAAFGIRNLAGYNQRVTKEEDDEHHPLPLILVVVDELADLMMTVSHDVEDAIVRIAQMGRAAGIHMIIATQRPSVDVITGLIKANVPSRIAFAVSSGVDSRTILDANGAERLLGRGDMLFQPIDKNKPIRVQGAFISDQDVEAVVNFIKEERPAEYDEAMVVSDAEMEAAQEAEDTDPLFDEALDFVTDQQRASTSMIQRRFRIGYNRAARILDEMEQRGYVSPANGAKPREVYRQPEE
ncbi:DNA translocase FtsK [Limosilactobacillus fermentum]|uniref:DNA translocase FtsK n=1 Tax=Limosilactobacillus fermentum TaxID=1613 RepID=UPI00019C65AC|nr:DNA translocase FtsK [Limosilactobacillus fermentum]EEI22134.1 FtsK/SpoIIIE family protein [Limosilactobacillus fermentum ATCC 14931]MCH5403628.1 DNA translocase FtsK [Limosilactobacillus fermentum]MDC6125862.1 DNA translocase FtsK [Limosilactobacillus fermentum]MDG9734735.1 DNA translocase FtsK [Limosilactobacillus fermentum]QCJ28084.1 DNA translocase FtsK [Limosilactobacillus fermentum]